MQQKWNSSKVEHPKSIDGILLEKAHKLVHIYNTDYYSIDESELPQDDQLICEASLRVVDDFIQVNIPFGKTKYADSLMLIIPDKGVMFKMPLKVVQKTNEEYCVAIKAALPPEIIRMQKREFQRIPVRNWVGEVRMPNSIATLRGEVLDLSYGGFQIKTKSKATLKELESVQVRIRPSASDTSVREIVCQASARRITESDQNYHIGFMIERFLEGGDRKFSLAIMGAERAIIKTA